MKNSIHIHQETCKKCLLCSEVCPNKILVLNASNEMDTRADRIDLCFQCGQCMAICSTRSIVVNGLAYEHDFFELPQNASYENAFHDLIVTRRAIRNFKDKPVPKELLEKIVQAVSFAPPGFPPIKTELIVVNNRQLIEEALPYMIDLYDFLVKAMHNPIKRFFIKKKVGRKRFATMQQHLIPLMIKRLPELKNGTEDAITRHAPAMILFLADRNGEDIEADIHIAAGYGMLAAHALGLGGSIMDIIPPAIEKKKELRKMFHVSDNQEVVASMIVGYPKYKYLRGIKRDIKNIKWIE